MSTGPSTTLDITDPVMSGLVFSNKHIAQPFIEYLLGIKIDHLEAPIPEAVLSYEALFKGVRNDVMNSDSDKKAQPRFSKNRYIVVDLPKFIELRKGVVSREDFWLRLISQGPLKVPKSDDPIFSDAIERLRVSRVKQDFLKAMEAQMSDDIHVREAIEAEYYLKGKAASDAKNEAANAARDSQRAEYLRSQNIPDDVISAMLAIK